MHLETYELPALGKYVHDPRRSLAPSARISQAFKVKLIICFAIARISDWPARIQKIGQER
jgi:hypothetical protein